MRLIEQVVDKQWPYCQHPECHNPRTFVYSDAYSTGPSVARNGTQVYISGPAPEVDGVHLRRWCYTHALLNEGVAFGGAS